MDRPTEARAAQNILSGNVHTCQLALFNGGLCFSKKFIGTELFQMNIFIKYPISKFSSKPPNMDGIDLSRGQTATLSDSYVMERLPSEMIEIIRSGTCPGILDTIAAASLSPALTLRLFTRFENIFADTCARWISRPRERQHEIKVIGSFARILPFAPHLSIYLENYLTTSKTPGYGTTPLQIIFPYLSDESQLQTSDLSITQLQYLLLAALRLLTFDKHIYSRALSNVRIQSLLQHAEAPVRYLSIRILCILLSTSNSKLEAMIDALVGREQALMGPFDGESEVDYLFLGLYEDKVAKDVEKLRNKILESEYGSTALNPSSLSPFVTCFGKTMLPRPNGKPDRPSSLITTDTTAKNLESLAKALQSNSPILIHGLSGSGKTSLINDFARELGKDSGMVTLHLNEQTDAKMLIGMYTTDSKPGSFTWRSGVLTTAIREGRWVFIEDLDRAPNEVISVILPLIERGELLIPSRGETVRAARGFKLIASIRTSLNMSGLENPPTMHMLGARLWNRVPVNMASKDEFQQIINGIHPILHRFLPGVIAVYERLYSLSQKSSFTSRSRTSLGRPISPRDLLKWCRRLEAVLIAAGSKTGDEPVSEATKDEMFMEAADCFAGSLQTEDTRKFVISNIAEEMQIPPQRVEHYLEAHIPRYEDGESQVVIGRARLTKRNTSHRIVKSSKRSRPFANTSHAKRLLEQVGVALKMAEPVLLVGETGIGKTTVIQQLADSLGYKLTAVNLSQQSEVGDLLGGFKPVNVRSLAIPLKEEFDELFASTGISATKNQKYLDSLGKSIAKGQWVKTAKLWREAPKMFSRILSEIKKVEAAKSRDAEQPAKRRKTESKLQALLELKPRWEKFSQSLEQFEVQLSGGSKGFAFSFIEGNIVRAARNGEWVLLDEINLASPDTLESIADLLHSGPGSTPSILLSETGEIERVRAHPDFRIFGAMNPATDVGKRDLPMGLRSRFTEIYVESPDRNLDDLLAVIKAYLKSSSTNDEKAAHDVARLYLNTKRLADEKRLVDGANQIPHFSLRTLTRVLSYVTEIVPSYGLRRALYEGYAMGFLTLLNRESERMLMPLINHHLLDSHGNPQALLAQTPRHPEDGRQYVRFTNKKRDRQYWMLQGQELPQEQPHYIITPFVERNMLNLVRATSTRKFPVLVQGPTSAGKTSMIEYLAKFSGNKFVRINNHEHTDLQEYLGTYVSDTDGQLRFQEGLLVQALREGHWIVLDELNLAPTDVLEALNRLLDDNRELLIPETQEIVRPHENFMLFATQNPPGLYGGRKTLSRAFRNRFLELHFDDIPEDELEFILQNRSKNVAPSDCKRIVTVYKELSRLRQSSRLFEQKDSFATLRDLFRWALRNADNREQLAANGYMLLAERVRKSDERTAVKEIIEKVMKVKIDPRALYSPEYSPEMKLYDETANKQGVVWTHAMRRLYVLVSHALRSNEPVLLVGETGCGKTTVCQMLANALGKELHIVNAHQNTETGDLIGAQRPVRNRATILKQLENDLSEALRIAHSQKPVTLADLDTLLAEYKLLTDESLAKVPQELIERVRVSQGKAKALFEWSDGSLVQAMKESQFFLLDEISLADDSVLERLNSVLEPTRTMLLAEKGITDSFVKAADGFQFFATMNPGGDYGKRELSPALRNRFTEIWVPSLSEHDDVFQIVETKLTMKTRNFAKAMVYFAEWFGQTYRPSTAQSISVRDVLAWVQFINGCGIEDSYSALLHGAAMVYVDTLGANPAALLAINPETIAEERFRCLQKLSTLVDHDMAAIYPIHISMTITSDTLTFGEFSIERTKDATADAGFAFDAPTTKSNAMRVIRALQVKKPILIEGSPGVGKTTLISALARVVGKPLTRINLSEQTDLMDLFGSDVPVEGAEAGNFAWRDAPFLQAMQRGDWVLLDEMNLASQSVLEGLNACLDHRGEVYISELDQTFKRHPNFSVFAAQNPHHQGGGRKGLPSSFVNRFTVVYADVFRNDDLTLICKHNFPAMDDMIMSNVISFVSLLEQEVVYRRRFGSQGGPWEFNLRDTLRWLHLIASEDPLLVAGRPADFLNLIFRQRFRSLRDRQEVDKIFSSVFGTEIPFRHLFHNMAVDAYQVGMAYLPRNNTTQHVLFPDTNIISRLPELESIMMSVQKNFPCILVGPSGSGKSTLIEYLAAATGAELVVFPLNADIDTMDLVGGFEQVDPQRAVAGFVQSLSGFLETRVISSLPGSVPSEALELLGLCQDVDRNSTSYFSRLHSQLTSLEQKTSLAHLDRYIESCQSFIDNPFTIENARFEWVDGILVEALEQGKWLVLDNANLCSSSVLDRLNGLLEPNGVLSINEHCGPDGKPKLVKPHPNFRLFMTMDSRFGELSRAMRNRAIEIFLEQKIDYQSNSINIRQPDTTIDRYGDVVKTLVNYTEPSEQMLSTALVALDHLSRSDLKLLPRFAATIQNGLIDEDSIKPQVMQLLQDQFEVLKTGDINSLGNNIGSMYDVLASAMKLPQSFGDAQVSDRAVPLYIESVLIAQFNRRLFIHFRTRLWFHCSKFHQALNKLIRLVPFSD
jgi:midasin